MTIQSAPWLPAHSPLSHGETQSVLKSFYLPCATPPPAPSLPLCVAHSLAGSVSHIPDRLGHSLGIQPCRANTHSAPAEDIMQCGPLITLHNGWTMPLWWKTKLMAPLLSTPKKKKKKKKP